MEIWKDIQGYEGLYQVSNLGNIKGLNKEVYNYLAKDNKMILKERNLKIFVHYSGYTYCYLFKNNIKSKKYMHRLVGETFLLDRNNYKELNHKDEIKSNNCENNLEWCDRSYNVAYSQGRSVNQYTLQGELIKNWSFIQKVERELNISHSTIIGCCKNRLKTAGGYIWRYAND
jgi:hypothetical protein